jgi:hypothetical protein
MAPEPAVMSKAGAGADSDGPTTSPVLQQASAHAAHSENQSLCPTYETRTPRLASITRDMCRLREIRVRKRTEARREENRFRLSLFFSGVNGLGDPTTASAIHWNIVNATLPRMPP